MINFGSVKGKVAVVTGATAGIGKAIAQVFAQSGMKVVLAARRKELGEKIAEDIRKVGGEAIFCQADVAKEEDVSKVMQTAVDTYGALHVVVNNAGASTLMHPIHEYDTDEFCRITNIDYIGVFLGMKYGVKAMLESGSKGCSIINISSAEGLVPTGCFSPYSGAKRAVNSISQTASLDYATHDITVNVIAPGATDTDIYSTIDEKQRELTQSMIPVGRFAAPEEIAYTALFLASDLARYITGAVIPVDGGMSAGNFNAVPWNTPDPRS